MYEILNEAHKGLAMLSVVLTLCWTFVVLVASRTSSLELAGLRRLTYVGAAASTGLVGVTGLIVMAMGSWLAMVFPWVGLVAVAGHGVAGARSRKALMAGNKGIAIGSAILQIVLLVLAYGLMTIKPF
jgi:tryptophan synthase alpha subunit